MLRTMPIHTWREIGNACLFLYVQVVDVSFLYADSFIQCDTVHVVADSVDQSNNPIYTYAQGAELEHRKWYA